MFMLPIPLLPRFRDGNHSLGRLYFYRWAELVHKLDWTFPLIFNSLIFLPYGFNYNKAL